MNTKKSATHNLVTLAMLCAVLLVMSFTPLGYLTIGPLAISLNMIPVAIGAISLGPVYGGVLGGVFGFTSFLQCLGVGGTSPMGVILFGISPVLAFLQRMLPRILAGVISGYLYQLTKKISNTTVACFVTGFSAALLNTLLFMLALVLMFGNTDYMKELIGGKNIIVFICAFVGINAVVEMLAATLIVGPVGTAMQKILHPRR